MRPAIPEYVPANTTPEELLRVLEPCVSGSVFRALEQLVEDAVEHVRHDDCVREQLESDLRNAQESESTARDLIVGIHEAWEQLDRSRTWTEDRTQWDRAVSQMRSNLFRARSEGLV